MNKGEPMGITMGYGRRKDNPEMLFVTWLQVFKQIRPGGHKHGIAIGGKGWCMRGITQMHLRRVNEKRGKQS